MNKPFLFGIGAGLIAFVALMSVTNGPPAIQFIMLLLAPLPVYLAGLRYGWPAAAIAALTGGIAITLLGGAVVGLLLAGSQFGPPVLLTYFALMNRTGPAQSGGAAVTQWYPVGRIVLWAAGLGTVLSVLLLLMLGSDAATVQANLEKILGEALKQAFSQQGSGEEVPAEHLEAMTKVAIALMPAASGMMLTGFMLFQLWLAGRIIRSTGFLERPWPDLAALTYPPITPLLLAGCIGLTAVLSGFAGMVASAASGALFFMYVLLGLAIIHYVTRGSAWRFGILWALYFGLIVFNTGLSMVLAMVGLAEPFSPLKRDFMRQEDERRPDDED
ncbi:MAG: DUF2232 domain-containing protein [Filomicrobium sp.]